MPNHCLSQIKIHCPHKAQEIADFLDPERPNPEPAPPTSEHASKVFSLERILPRPTDDWLPQPPKSESGYSFPAWYDWTVTHWGTKWDTMEAYLAAKTRHSLVYHITTAWSPPEPALLKLSSIFPGATIDLRSTDEFANFAYGARYAHGSIVTSTENQPDFERALSNAEEDVFADDFLDVITLS